MYLVQVRDNIKMSYATPEQIRTVFFLSQATIQHKYFQYIYTTSFLLQMNHKQIKDFTKPKDTDFYNRSIFNGSESTKVRRHIIVRTCISKHAKKCKADVRLGLKSPSLSNAPLKSNMIRSDQTCITGRQRNFISTIKSE